MKPLAIDLFCGLGGWTEGLLAKGYRVVGFDIEAHEYCEMRYPAKLVLQDVRTIDGSKFKDAHLIVASPPCQEYSYMAMPWKRAKQIEKALLREGRFPDGYKGSRTVAQLNELFDACFRIQREVSQAAGRRIPLVVENVKGAQKWVGKAPYHYGSYYLWGDVPALMIGPLKAGEHAIKNQGGSWFRKDSKGRLQAPNDGRYQKVNQLRSTMRDHSSKSVNRKMASALIAKIPFRLSSYIAEFYHPERPW